MSSEELQALRSRVSALEAENGRLRDAVAALPWVEDERHGAGLRFGGTGHYGAGEFYSPEVSALREALAPEGGGGKP